MGKRGALRILQTVGTWNAAAPLEKSLAVPLHVEHGVTVWPSNSNLKYTVKRTETCPHKKTCKQMITAAFYVTAKKGGKTHVCQLTNAQTRRGLCTWWNIIKPRKGTWHWRTRQLQGPRKTWCQVEEARHPMYASVSTGGPAQTTLKTEAAHWLPGAGGAGDVEWKAVD